MAIGIWKTASVFDRYNIVSERDLHDAAATLEQHLAEVEQQLEKAETRPKPSSADFGCRELLNEKMRTWRNRQTR